MPTIKLKISDKIFPQIISLLKRFDKDELEVILDDDLYADNKNYLQQELDQLAEGKAEYLSIDELELELNNVIKKNENRF